MEVDQRNEIITVRIREHGSFASGRAELIEPFAPVLDKIVRALEITRGRVVLAGHTDGRPIRTERFRSNWELSAARAVTMAHRVLARSALLSPERITIRGHADTRPLVPNDTAANRARNRRVEVLIVQGQVTEDVADADADGLMG